ncbi:glycine/betaine ABC transporter ATP-binding protein [Saccharopolyspora subtropica]|uniref:Glycine/betaine ABC transporter ATP-binding protein n=1 Tax=Saccharopolyspora thermophila TaxID=89367 RepID=A0A917NFG5_9PSEU|nr:glycine betaine/L-proline ABC transporter ATP-binding protein [Saccharopolyspora subtropica]GGI95827.1 glycine/betaine ABC transporter ATP-binding protein [Saccharopolyspora subtropica]
MTSVRVEHLYKIFGPQPTEQVRRLQAGASQKEIRAAGATAAVVDATFEVAEGETFVVMGLSGSGKSTLIRMLNGLLTPTSGHVYVDGDDITGMSRKQLRTMRQRTMSMVFQHFALFPHRTVLENAGYGLEVRGSDRSEIVEKAREALSMVGLAGWEERYPQQLSGGMRQRVGLARALAAHTDVLLMDEAFSALDPLIKREMQDQLVRLQAKLGKTIIFITHDLNEAMRLGDRIAMMRAGRIVQIGTAEQILNEPADDYVAEFVQDVDRSRVLTAASLAEPRPTVSAQSRPDEALTQLRRLDTDLLLVTDGDQLLLGELSAAAAEKAYRDGSADIRSVLTPVADAVDGSTPMKDLFVRMSSRTAPVPVIDQQRRLLGVVTPTAVFQALSREAAAPTTEEASDV